MTDIDRLVKDWILSKFLKGDTYSLAYPYGYDETVHGPKEDITVVAADGEWQCGCYSEYTRDDQFVMTATFMTKSGHFKASYGRWGDLPVFIEELASFEETWECSIEAFEEYSE